MPKRSREENVAKYGGGHALEARGLEIVRKAVEADGRLCLVTSFEGARADCCVHRPGDAAHALGIQLKTTESVRRTNASGSRQYVSFQQTKGYDGLLLILVAFHDNQTSIWTRSGSTVHSIGLTIPLVALTTLGAFAWSDFQTTVEDLPGLLLEALEGNDYPVAPASDFAPPTSSTRIIEYEAQLRLEAQLPLPYIPAPVAHSPYDYTVHGARWQMKVAGYVGSLRSGVNRDYFRVTLMKSAGIGKTQQYGAQDFDWLAIQLPLHKKLEGVTPRLYLVPMRELTRRGLVSEEAAKSGSAIYLYPHRTTSNEDAHWAENFAISLSDPELALAEFECTMLMQKLVQSIDLSIGC